MLLCHVVLLFLSCPYTRASGEQNIKDGTLDQEAVASHHIPQFLQQSGEDQVLQETTAFDLQLEAMQEATTIHYENANGFVPVTPADQSHPGDQNEWENRSTEDRSSAVDSLRKGGNETNLVKDAMHSSEAKSSDPNRRSFDTDDRQNDFELLKVKEDTPAVANYREFYDSFQTVRSTTSVYEDFQSRYNDNSGNSKGDNRITRPKSRNRGKKIENYMTNYGLNLNHDTGEETRYNEYYSLSTIGTTEENVLENFGARDIIKNYDFEKENNLRQKATSSHEISNATTDFKSDKLRKDASNKNRQRNSQPVVVLEPSQYDNDMRFDNEHTRNKAPIAATTAAPYKSTKNHATDVSKETRFAHEALFGRDESNHNYGRSEESEDFSEEELEYVEVIERPRKIRKNRRRPHANSDSSRRIPKEHREAYEDFSEPEVVRKRQHHSRSKPSRHRVKSNRDEDDRRSHRGDESSEEVSRDIAAQGSAKFEVKNHKQNVERGKSNSWSHVSPNIEISHSSGIEIDQAEKPKLIVPVKVNLVPATNFDHASAMGNSQGFDISNAVLHNLVTPTPVFSTVAPILTTAQPAFDLGKAYQNIQHHNLKIAVPDVIVGQSTLQNPVETVFKITRNNLQNHHRPTQSTLRTHYLHSTAAPVLYTVAHNTSPNVQNAPSQNHQSIATSTPAYSSNHQLVNDLQQQVRVNNQIQNVAAGSQQIVIPHPTTQTLSNVVRNPAQTTSGYSIQVNPNGLHGQNVPINGNSHVVQNLLSASTTIRPNVISNGNPQVIGIQNNRNILPDSDRQFLASASLSVDSHLGQQTNSGGSVSGSNNNVDFYNYNGNLQSFVKPPTLHENFYQPFKDNSLTEKTKAYIRNIQEAPTILTPALYLGNVNLNSQSAVGAIDQSLQGSKPAVQISQYKIPEQQILRAANHIFENTLKQLQQLQKGQSVSNNNRYVVSGQNLRTVDNVGSQSERVNSANTVMASTGGFARNPQPSTLAGTKNVEILNPGVIKPSPVDLTLVNPYESSHYPTVSFQTTPNSLFGAVNLVTPKPILSTTAQSITLQNYVDSLTEIGTRANAVGKLETKPSISQSQTFNPINFVPNPDLLRSQKILNNLKSNEQPWLNNLNLVPLVPGGNFDRNSLWTQNNLLYKPKLSADLQKYAEEMFKESLRTIYNSQKWNNDGKINYRDQRNNSSPDLSNFKDSRHVTALNSELKQYKETLEAHHTENKPHAVEPDKQEPEIQNSFKSDFKLPPSAEPVNIFYNNKFAFTPSDSIIPSDSVQSSFGFGSDFTNIRFPDDFLTPPKPNSFFSKIPFNGDHPTTKQRPIGSGSSRYNFENVNSRLPSRPRKLKLRNFSRPSNTENSSTSGNGDFSSSVAAGSSRYENYQKKVKSENDDSEASRQNFYDIFNGHPSLATSIPESEHLKSSNDHYDINHPRMHNLFTLLRKNKRLPLGNSQNFFRDKDELRQYLENEKQKLQQDFYDETFKDFQKKSDHSEKNSKDENFNSRLSSS